MKKKFIINCLVGSIFLVTGASFAADTSQDLQISGSIRPTIGFNGMNNI